MPLTRPLQRVVLALSLAAAATSHAAVVNGADVGGFRTFVDTSTGRVWADLDNHLAFTGTGFVFRFADTAEYLSALQAAGFTWADSASVSAFTAATPLVNPVQFGAIGVVMGSLSFFETTTIDGLADAGPGLAQRHHGVRNVANGTADWALGAAGPTPTALGDAGLWAYIAGPTGGGSVPAPGTAALAALAGWVGWAMARRQRPRRR